MCERISSFRPRFVRSHATGEKSHYFRIVRSCSDRLRSKCAVPSSKAARRIVRDDTAAILGLISRRTSSHMRRGNVTAPDPDRNSATTTSSKEVIKCADTHAWPDQRQRHLPQRAGRRGAQTDCCLFKSGIDTGQAGGDAGHHKGYREARVRQHDGDRRAHEAITRECVIDTDRHHDHRHDQRR